MVFVKYVHSFNENIIWLLHLIAVLICIFMEFSHGSSMEKLDIMVLVKAWVTREMKFGTTDYQMSESLEFLPAIWDISPKSSSGTPVSHTGCRSLQPCVMTNCLGHNHQSYWSINCDCTQLYKLLHIPWAT